MNTKQANRASWSKINVKRKRKSRTHLSHKKQSSKRQKIVEIQDNDDHVEKELVNSSPVDNKDSRLSTSVSKPLKKGILRNKQDTVVRKKKRPPVQKKWASITYYNFFIKKFRNIYL